MHHANHFYGHAHVMAEYCGLDPAEHLAIGRDHNLPEPSAIGPDGRMTAAGLEGLTQKEAEEKILAWVKERGLL